ncbi:MAG: type II secretion system major pseudopilin GspG [Planctomycetales bacterium]|nr:type II secretion system major pseudopilin GspG [Planctomycetales bacterium]
MSRRRSRRTGFTLLEVLLVLVILVILGSMATVFIRGAGQRARRRAAEAQISAFDNALKMYEIDFQRYPDSSEGLNALRFPPQGGAPYLDKDPPLDPWGSPYQYTSDGDSFRIWSLGPDGNPDTGDDVG